MTEEGDRDIIDLRAERDHGEIRYAKEKSLKIGESKLSSLIWRIFGFTLALSILVLLAAFFFFVVIPIIAIILLWVYLQHLFGARRR